MKDNPLTEAQKDRGVGIHYRSKNNAYGDLCLNCQRQLSEHTGGYWYGRFVSHTRCPSAGTMQRDIDGLHTPC
jgi:hypothetical protein